MDRALLRRCALAFVLLPPMSDPAWSETASPPSSLQAALQAYHRTFADCEAELRTVRAQAEIARAARTAVTPPSPADLQAQLDAYRGHCRGLRGKLDELQAEARRTATPPTSDSQGLQGTLTDLERRLAILLMTEHRVETAVKGVETERQRKAEAARQKAEVDQRRAAAEEKRQQDAEQRATDNKLKKRQQIIPNALPNENEIVSDK